MDADAVADELYQLAPEEFVATRDDRVRRAREEGDRDAAKAIAALRKPSTSAWLANLLVRREPDTVRVLLELGPKLRDAQARLAGDDLRELAAQRRQLVTALVARAHGLARDGGARLGATVERQLQDTLTAVLADDEAAATFATGRLTGPLQPAGLDAFPTAPAAGSSPPTRPARSRTPSRAPSRPGGHDKHRATETRSARTETRSARTEARNALAEARSVLAEARKALADADRAVARRQRDLQRAAEHRADRQERVEQLTAELAEARSRESAAGREERDARRELADAEGAQQRARRRAERAQATVARLSENS